MPKDVMQKATENTRKTKTGDKVHDPLLECLSTITRLLNRPLSPTALAAGLPLQDGVMDAEMFLKSADRAGFSARFLEIALEDISTLTLPCVLLLKNRRACVLAGRSGQTKAHVIFPETGRGAGKVSMKRLAKEYTGSALFVKPEFRLELPEPGTRGPGKGWFWPEIFSNWFVIAQVVLASGTVNVLTLAIPLFIMNVYDRVVPNFAVETLWVLAFGVFVVIIFDFVLKNLRYYFIDATSRNLDTIFSSRIYEKILSIRIDHQTGSPGALAGRIRSFETLRDFFSSATLVAFVDLPFAVLFITIMGYLGGFPVAIVPVIGATLIIGLGLFFHGPMVKYMQSSFQESTQRHGLLVETLQRLEIVKVLGIEGRMQYKWDTLIDSQARSAMKERRLSSMFTFLAGNISNLAYVSIIITGVYQVAEGVLSLGGLIACAILSSRIMAPLLQIAGIFARMQQARVALSSLNRLMAMVEERAPGRKFLNRPRFDGAIEFRSLYYRYPGRKTPALSGLKAVIKPGERVGILGKSGSGKSTLLKMILGLFPAVSGSVLVDHADVLQLDPAELRGAIGYVPQQTDLFSGTLRDNIVLGSPHVDDAAVMEALSMTGFLDTVQTDSLGLDRHVGPQGSSLSGGERQAVCLARAFVSQRPIYLLDEPASAMDTLSEQIFIRAVPRKLEKSTLLIVTQRLQMLQLVDRVIVMDKGTIVADGPRDDVIKALTRYAKENLGLGPEPAAAANKGEDGP